MVHERLRPNFGRQIESESSETVEVAHIASNTNAVSLAQLCDCDNDNRITIVELERITAWSRTHHLNGIVSQTVLSSCWEICLRP